METEGGDRDWQRDGTGRRDENSGVGRGRGAWRQGEGVGMETGRDGMAEQGRGDRNGWGMWVGHGDRMEDGGAGAEDGRQGADMGDMEDRGAGTAGERMVVWAWRVGSRTWGHGTWPKGGYKGWGLWWGFGDGIGDWGQGACAGGQGLEIGDRG